MDVSDSPARPHRPSLREILGLSAPAGGDWTRIHAAQYALVPERVQMRVIVHAVGYALACLLLAGRVHWGLLLGWGLVLGAAALRSACRDREMAGVDQRVLDILEIRRHAIATGIKGSIWGTAIAVFGLVGPPGTLATMWGLGALLVMASAISRHGAPLSSLAFAGGVSAGALVGAAATLDAGLATVVVFTALLAAIGIVENARAALDARMTELVMQEKSETVSMLLREFEEGQADWLWQIDTSRRLQAVSPRFAYALGREPGEAEGVSFLQLVSGDAWKTGKFPRSLHELAERLKKKENFSNLIVEVTIAGEKRWWELSGTPIIDESGVYQGFRGVGSDVTEQRESSEKIAYLARYDTLTALPNRLMLNENLGEALKFAEHWRTRCAFLMIDLDRFKAINDSLGHVVGDRMLAEVAGRLQSLIREGELCGRLGGDEFAVVIRDASDKRRIESLARAIIARLSEPYQIEHHVLYVGASVGSAIGPRDGRTVEEMLRNADLALYRAKDEGGGEHCEYEPSFHATAEEKRQLEYALRTALEKDEMLLHYQPVVDARSEQVVSFEALIRWNSKEHGFISPAKFIPLAEDTRLIVPIGTWVMNEACREAAANWPASVKVNINVSPEQLLEPDFVSTVVRALSHSGLDPKRLEIEVTESIFVRDADVARKALEQCMALGCSIALDDFGTGYSSLGYLRTLRFSTIKVDRSFVQGAAQRSPESLAIIRAVVAMAESLEMTTTAEGVENQDEAELIRRLGCNKIQGYHFGRPMPAADVRKIFARQGLEQQRLA